MLNAAYIPVDSTSVDIKFESVSFSYPTRPEQVRENKKFQSSGYIFILNHFTVIDGAERFQFIDSCW